ncbi:MAG TPA: Asp23/Gls24 family envelope stress response protein [Anaerolineae bacterium]
MIGKVTISPEVVREVARITTLATPGVLAMAERPIGRNNVDPGVSVVAQDDTLQIKLSVIAAVNQPLHKLGQQIQANVAGAVTEIAGMTVTKVDVTFEDVRSQA